MPRRPAQPKEVLEIAIYDGLHFLGCIKSNRVGFVAFDKKMRRLGCFETKDAARLAIAAASPANNRKSGGDA